MAQAETISTAIFQLMSRGGRRKCTSPVRLAHVELIAALGAIVPPRMYADVDSEDLDARADHLENIFAALHVYLTAIIADGAQNIPSRTLDRRYLDKLLTDLSADVVCVIRNAAEMGEHENWRAS